MKTRLNNAITENVTRRVNLNANRIRCGTVPCVYLKNGSVMVILIVLMVPMKTRPLLAAQDQQKTAMMINFSVTTDAALINIGNVIMIMIVEMDLMKARSAVKSTPHVVQPNFLAPTPNAST
jgi:hypothetical protein